MQCPLLKPGVRTKSRPRVSGNNCSVFQSKLQNKEIKLGSAFQWKEGEAQMTEKRMREAQVSLRMPGISARGSVTWAKMEMNPSLP